MTATLATATKKRSRSGALLRNLQAYSLLAPAYLFFVIFTFIPIGWALILSFQKYDVFANQGTFIGAKNYTAAITSGQFWSALWHTAYFTVGSVVVIVLLALFVAAQMYSRRVHGKAILQVLFFLPYIVSSVGSSMVWKWMFDGNFGLINIGLSAIHVPAVQWLTNPSAAMPAMIIMAVWGNAGFAILLFEAGLKAIPKELLEAAYVDGSTRWKTFRSITFPLLAPTTLFVIIMLMINATQEFTMFQVMTQGGPLSATTVIVYYIYQQAFTFYNMGYGSALAIVLLVITLLLTGLQLWVSRRYVYYEGERTSGTT